MEMNFFIIIDKCKINNIKYTPQQPVCVINTPICVDIFMSI